MESTVCGNFSFPTWDFSYFSPGYLDFSFTILLKISVSEKSCLFGINTSPRTFSCFFKPPGSGNYLREKPSVVEVCTFF